MPWCKKLPSAYFASNIRVTTQPYDHDEADDIMLKALDGYGAEDSLLFATDYPHWDADVPLRALSGDAAFVAGERRLPERGRAVRRLKLPVPASTLC